MFFSKKAKEPEYKTAACDISVTIDCYDSDITGKSRVWEVIE